MLYLAAVLGAMAPAGHLHSNSAEFLPEAAFVHIHSEIGMADVTINPGHAGKVAATIRLTREDSLPLAASRVTLALDPPQEPSHVGQPTVQKDAVLMPDGTWGIAKIELPVAGIWTARVIVAPEGAAPFVLDGPIVITQCSNECW